MPLTADLLIVTYNRCADLRETLGHLAAEAANLTRIVVVDNHSADETPAVLAEFAARVPNLRSLRLPENAGPCVARNAGLRECAADIVIGLDDDAFFSSPEPVRTLLERFAADPQLGLIACKIVNYYTGQVQKKEFPIRPGRYGVDDEFPASYFTGAGWAARREAVMAAGGFCEALFMHHEELDLSCRLINRGWTIRYVPAAEVRHKQAPGGRRPPRTMLHLQLRNRLLIGWRYFPARYRLVAHALWILKTIRSSRSLSLPVAAVRDFLRLRRTLPRDPFRPQALAYLRAHGGRLYF